MRRIERAALPEPGEFRRLLCSVADQIHPGGKIVDADAQGLTGVDIIMTDEDGSAILVDFISDCVEMVPTRVYEHLDWLDDNRRLFLRAYTGDGLVSADAPVLIFIAPDFPSAVVRAVSRISDASVRLVRVEQLIVDGEPGLLLETIELTQTDAVSAAVVRRVPELGGGREPSFESRIESGDVRTLFTLFRSGVDGLDGRISTREVDGVLHFSQEGVRLATVAASPGSFTVASGDPVVNPIVVSDRVSLERALNAVISFFVREGRVLQVGENGNGGAPGGANELSREEHAELRRIWDDGIPGGAGS